MNRALEVALNLFKKEYEFTDMLEKLIEEGFSKIESLEAVMAIEKISLEVHNSLPQEMKYSYDGTYDYLLEFSNKVEGFNILDVKDIYTYLYPVFQCLKTESIEPKLVSNEELSRNINNLGGCYISFSQDLTELIYLKIMGIDCKDFIDLIIFRSELFVLRTNNDIPKKIKGLFANIDSDWHNKISINDLLLNLNPSDLDYECKVFIIKMVLNRLIKKEQDYEHGNILFTPLTRKTREDIIDKIPSKN